MRNATRLGMDVHKETIAVAILRPRQEIPDERVIPNTPEALRTLVAKSPARSELIACYEAGPTGYDTYRQLTALGVRCDVIAPALIPRRAGRRVKTDRLDARNLVRLHRAGELTAIRVPTPEEEALRDLIRVREDLKDDRRRTQQRVRGFLLRQGRRYPGASRGWSDKYDLWVRAQHFDEPAAEAAFRHYVAALDTRRTHLKAIDSEIEAAANQPRWPSLWPGSGAFAASTRCSPSPSPPRCATSGGSPLPPPSCLSPGWSLPSSQAVRASGEVRSRRPGTPTCDGHSFRRRGPIGTRQPLESS